MQRLALLTAALLGSSTAAGAWPWRAGVTVHTDNDRANDYDRRTDDRRYDDRRYDDGDRRDRDRYDADDRDRGERFVQLATLPMDAKSRADIGAQAGAFSRLRIQGVNGRPMLNTVVVRFMNGSMQTINVNRRLGHGEVFDVDLRGRMPIAAIAVHGQPDGHSELTIYGE